VGQTSAMWAQASNSKPYLDLTTQNSEDIDAALYPLETPLRSFKFTLEDLGRCDRRYRLVQADS
jgi:hypothetical protein